MGTDPLDTRSPSPPKPADSPPPLLRVEVEPTADGQKRAILYPSDVPETELESNWLALPADLLFSLDDMR